MASVAADALNSTSATDCKTQSKPKQAVIATAPADAGPPAAADADRLQAAGATLPLAEGAAASGAPAGQEGAAELRSQATAAGTEGGVADAVAACERQLQEKVAHVTELFSDFQLPKLEIYRSDPDHYRLRYGGASVSEIGGFTLQVSHPGCRINAFGAWCFRCANSRPAIRRCLTPAGLSSGCGTIKATPIKTRLTT